MRVLAESLARSGVAVLRFDYSGTGDSADISNDADIMEAWTEDTRTAMRFLRDASAVQSIALVGLRLGASIAALSIRDDDTVRGFAPIFPIVSGRAYLRELTILSQTGEPGAAVAAAGFLESGGYALSSAAQDSIRKVDPAQLSFRHGLEVLLIEREELSSSGSWESALSQCQCRVSRFSMAGYPEMMLDPHRAVVPTSLVAKIVNWTGELQARSDFGNPRVLADCDTGADPLPAVATSRLEANGVSEQSAFVRHDSPGRGMVGVLSRPLRPTSRGTPSGRGLLFLNAGAVSRTGPGRLYVDLARRRAAIGDNVLRIDLAGIGDSSPIPGSPENFVYDPHAIGLSVVAAQFMARSDLGAPTLIGLCSGAYHALRAAFECTDIHRVVAINPLVFLAKKGEIISGDMVTVATTVERYRTNIWRLESWARVASGQVNLRLALAAVLRHRWESVKGRLRDFSRSIGMPWTYDLGWKLQQLASRGTRVDFIFAEGDPGYELLKIDAGSALGELLDNGSVHIHFVPDADHTFSRLEARSALAVLIDQIIDE